MSAHPAMSLGDRRLASQALAGPGLARPEDVVRHMGALQAQDYGQALWAIAARTPNATIAEVEAAFADGRIVRTWPMRSTLHVVAPENARWMTALSAPRRLQAAKRRLAELELDQAALTRATALFEAALRGHNRLTRPEMLAMLEREGISTTGQRGYHLLWYAAQTGQTCFGPVAGKQQTFVLLDEWAPQARALADDDALTELARLYFTSHGPASVQDFAWWSGTSLTEARRGLQGAAPQLASERVGDRELWSARAAIDPVASGARLLPGFDEFYLGYQDRSAVVDAAFAPRVVPGNNGMFKATIVVDGRVVGTWGKRLDKRGLHVMLSPFEPDEGLLARLRPEAERLARAYGVGLGGVAIAPD